MGDTYVSLYQGAANNVLANQEIVAVHTVKTLLLRLDTLLQAEKRAYVYLIIDERDASDPWMEFLCRVGRRLHDMGKVKLGFMSATLGDTTQSETSTTINLGLRPYAVTVIPVCILQGS